jgi:hypothetical protein
LCKNVNKEHRKTLGTITLEISSRLEQKERDFVGRGAGKNRISQGDKSTDSVNAIYAKY